MAKQLQEEEQNLKRKARRRLMGAFALTLAIVVILPMVLDSEPKPGGINIELQIPGIEESGKFLPKNAVSDVPAVLPEIATTRAANIKSDENIASTAEPKVNTGESNGKPVEVNGNPAGSKDVSISKPIEKAEAVPNQKANVDPAPGIAAERYVAQVGAYSNPKTAKQELDKLKKWGFKVYTEKAAGMIRVRVGQYTDRSKAEKVQQLLEKHGLHPVIMSDK